MTLHERTLNNKLRPPLHDRDDTMPKRHRRFFRLRLLLLAVLLATVGALVFTAWPFLTYPTTTLTISRPAPLPAATSGPALAGLAETDITPPIGIPKFGYSAWARPAD